MTKLFACFALFCLIGTAFSDAGDTCTSNSLLTVYGFEPVTTVELDSTDYKYCKSLQAGTSCCEDTIVNKFQDDIDDLAETLADSVIKRDKAIVLLRDTTIPGLGTKLTTLKDNAEEALVTIAAAIAAEAAGREDEPTVDPYSLEEASELATGLLALAEDTIDNLAGATTGFTAFQKARGACVIELLNLQAAAWCLACDPTANDQGVGLLGAISISDDTCTRLKGSCYDYVTASATQSSILSVAWISTIVDNLNTALAAVAEEANEAGLQLLSSAVEPAEEIEHSFETAAVDVPLTCTSESECNWICTSLFVEGEISQALIVGGDFVESPLVETTPVQAEPPAGGRRLQDEWAPAADEAGVTVTWKDDPADVNSDDDVITLAGAGIIKSGFVCVIALLSVFFF